MEGHALSTILDKVKICRLLSEALQKDEKEILSFPDNMPLEDIGLNSMCFIKFIVAVEEAFEIEIRDSDLLLERFRTLELTYTTLSTYLEFTPIRKVLVLDCDNVLWHGISGEEQIEVDENLIIFQQQLIKLYEQGVLLCLCSRNDWEFVRNSFQNKAMLLSEQHIVSIRANHNNKVDNLREISTELNLSLDSFVFVDDSDYELGMVQTLLPEVVCIPFCNPVESVLEKLTNLFSSVTAGNPNRTQQYLEQKEREKSKKEFTNIDEYNRSLNTVINCARADETSIARLVELSQRTQQFNLADTHYTKGELLTRLQDPNYIIITMSAADTYGDMGVVGMTILHNAYIEAFILSCRVFDRGFEQVLLNAAKRSVNNILLYGIYHQTDKNKRYIDFYPNNEVMHYER